MDHYTSHDLEGMTVEALSELYNRQLAFLNHKLLEGTDWKDLTEARHALTKIGVAIDMKMAAQSLLDQRAANTNGKS